MKHTEWTIYRARRLWTSIFSGELLIFLLFFWLFDKNAFFLLGPFCLYNLSVYLFPYWYQLFFVTDFVKGPIFQQFERLAKETFPTQVRLDLRLFDNEFANLIVFAHHNKIWIWSSSDFIERFSKSELTLLLEELKNLFTTGRLQSATYYSALQFTLPVGLWPHNRGSELIFFSQNEDIRWQRLNFKVFHWNDGKNSAARPPLVPCLLFPALTNYSPASYFSVYNFLREKLITALKSEETAYGK
jgi:hypothetical protein